MDNQKNSQHDTLKWVIVGFLASAILALVFSMGMFVGQERAQFSFRWAENYHRNFGGPYKGFMGNFPTMDFTNSHGVFGHIINIDSPSEIGKTTLIVKDEDNKEKTIIVSSETIILNQSRVVLISDIHVGDTTVIIGSPNTQGQIEARLMRVFPPGTSFIPRKIKNI